MILVDLSIHALFMKNLHVTKKNSIHYMNRKTKKCASSKLDKPVKVNDVGDRYEKSFFFLVLAM